jgi:hypothetical protein
MDLQTRKSHLSRKQREKGTFWFFDAHPLPAGTGGKPKPDYH